MKKIIISLSLFLIATVVSAEECHIVYGATATYEPYEWRDTNGNFFGMNIDLLKAISQKTNCSLEIVNYERTDMLQKLKNGEISMLSLSPTSFTDTFAEYLPHSIVLYRNFFTRIDLPDITSFDDLKGKTLVVIKDGFSEDYLSKIKDQYGMNVITFKDRHDVVRALSDGRADATVVTMTFMTGALKAMNIDNIKVTGSPLLPSPYGFVVNKKNKLLYDKVDKAINELKASGEYFEIIKKWSIHEPSNSFSKKLILLIMSLGFAILLVIMLWNKLLYAQVQKKTKNLNEEIEIRKRIEIELIKSKSTESKMREEAIMAGKLAALGEMATSVAHEINNPLGLIAHNVAFNNKLLGELIDHQLFSSGNVEFCNMNIVDAKAQYLQSVQTTNKSIKRIQTAINELKDFGKKHPDGHQLIELKKCVFQAVKLTSYFTKKICVRHHSGHHSRTCNNIWQHNAH